MILRRQSSFQNLGCGKKSKTNPETSEEKSEPASRDDSCSVSSPDVAEGCLKLSIKNMTTLNGSGTLGSMISEGRHPQKAWKVPAVESSPQLTLFNSFTRKKEPFVPMNPKQVKWYICGPTVYDSSHIGHARAYLSFDILRRILQDYFGYDILYIMNITDIDDKIIKRARQLYLLENYIAGKFGELSVTKVIEDTLAALDKFKSKCIDEIDPDKKKMLGDMCINVNVAVKKLENSLLQSEQQEIENSKNELLDAAKDVLSDWLDSLYKHTVNDFAVFDRLAKKYENEFLYDMACLNVLPPNVLTRVSEYIPEIIAYVQKIIDNGYGYVTDDGSVYFDTVKFDKSDNHIYCKLVPEAFADSEQLIKNMRESEGELSMGNLQNKKNITDFALWKASKEGEPYWSSPWGNGRPGWHIECSAMSSKICGSSLDIHAGGFDLKFPHHDNEIAQVEAHYDIGNWVNYFLHCGSLRIAGLKMSKSLKNFITIREALKDYSARQLRILFLMHNWNDVLDYSTASMERALQFEKITNEFFLLVKDCLRRHYKPDNSGSYQKYSDRELDFVDEFCKIKTTINIALCDSIDTRTVIEKLRELIAIGNAYINEMEKRENKGPNCLLLRSIALYMTWLLKVFGVVPQNTDIGFPLEQNGLASNHAVSTTSKEELLMPYLTALADFRENVRKVACEQKTVDILEECDRLRDEVLPELGVRLEDRAGQTCVKFVDKATLLREKEQKKVIEAAKEEEKRRKECEKAEKEALKRIPPWEMFKQGKEASKYSKYDDKGIPTHVASGEEISKKQRKKLEKLYETQQKSYEQIEIPLFLSIPPLPSSFKIHFVQQEHPSELL
uniref:Cysteine--tRNA ligase, cytoplasmic n=1 Tax=Setaria digitata TaxID=48799 RepID=A0A915PWB8_9BILA